VALPNEQTAPKVTYLVIHQSIANSTNATGRTTS
jgi:hypothetical protein